MNGPSKRPEKRDMDVTSKVSLAEHSAELSSKLWRCRPTLFKWRWFAFARARESRGRVTGEAKIRKRMMNDLRRLSVTSERRLSTLFRRKGLAGALGISPIPNGSKSSRLASRITSPIQLMPTLLIVGIMMGTAKIEPVRCISGVLAVV